VNFKYDIRGNLQANEIVPLDWADFKTAFVTDFSKISTTRENLLANFIAYLKIFQQSINPNFKVWIDGSFISNKTDPRDIDALFLLDYKIAERYKSILDNQFFIKDYKLSKGLDLYYSCEYPENHKRHFLSHLNHLYWQDVYGHTRKDINGFQYSKGFVELTFDSTWKN
jgi:hypothetical protein